MSANPPPLSAEMLLSIRQMFAAGREMLADPDSKVRLKAMSELAKLVATCKRMGIDVPAEGEPTAPPATPNTGSETVRRQKAETLTSVFTPRSAESNHPPQPQPTDSPPLRILGGKPLSCFLGGAKPPSSGSAPIRPGPSG
jgi:hypothetical protein